MIIGFLGDMMDNGVVTLGHLGLSSTARDAS